MDQLAASALSLTRVSAEREVAIRFIKSHGLGNDYLVLCSGQALSSETVIRICHRHKGLGSDGILEPWPASDGRHGLRIWNPDGSQAEKSGNGLRIFARWLHDHQAAGSSFEVEVPAGVALCEVRGDGQVTVDMGRPIFEASKIPTQISLWQHSLVVADTELSLCAVSVGNPHCVIPFAAETNLDSLPWKKWGSLLEAHDFFPNRTNVQFFRAIDRHQIEMRIWERGAGPTSASGSSAVAVFCVARRLGWLGPSAHVQMLGGSLFVEEQSGGSIFQTGPVEEIGELTLGVGFFAQTRP
jgi:diaminopimelate epimerase